MAQETRIGCLLMAAGAGTRFGPDKLLVEFRGKPLIQWALEAIPADRLCRVAVVTGDQRIRTMAEGFGFSPVWNDRPELGVSRTIRLGLEALAPICDGVIFQVADQPLLRRETVASLAETWLANPEQIIVPAAGGCWGNPCVFPKDLFPALCALTGDVGGKAVIRANRERVLEVSVPQEELGDVDTAAALEALRSNGQWTADN